MRVLLEASEGFSGGGSRVWGAAEGSLTSLGAILSSDMLFRRGSLNDCSYQSSLSLRWSRLGGGMELRLA